MKEGKSGNMEKKYSFICAIAAVLIASLITAVVGCSGFGLSDPPDFDKDNQEHINPAIESDKMDSDDDTTVIPYDISSPEYINQIVNPDRSLFEGETITIATWIAYDVNHFAVMYMSDNPGVTIRINSHNHTLMQDNPTVNRVRDWNFDTVQLEIATQLMADSAPTLIDGFFADPYDPRQSIYFYDWYALMDADRNFNEDDWFMNAFHAFSINNRLYHFPLSFRYEPVVTNSTIHGLVDAMTAKADGVTISELIELHRRFVEDNPGFYLEEYFTTRMLMEYAADQFVDFEAGRVDFSEEFIDLLTYVKSITCPDFERRWRRSTETGALEPQKSERYFFHMDYNMNFLYFLDFHDERLFTNITPLVNERGEMLIESEHSYLLNANATLVQKAIAWDFMMYVMEQENHAHYGMSHFFLQATNRDVLNHHITSTLPDSIRVRYSWFSGTDEEAIDGVFAKMTEFGEMPMQNTRKLPRVIDNIIMEAIGQFHDGVLSAEQTAELLQNQVTIALMEMAR